MNYYYLGIIILLILFGILTGKIANKVFGLIVSFMGILILVGYIYYEYSTENINSLITGIQWPPRSYMRDIGSKCPDYWYVESKDENEVKCKFNMKIDPNLLTNCFDNDGLDSKTKTFPKIKSIPQRLSQEHIDWFKECKYSNYKPSWIGLDHLV